MLLIRDLVSIATIACIIINSGAIDNFKHLLWRWLKGNAPYRSFSLKPFDCELCTTWWSGLLYIIITHQFTLSSLLLVALVAWVTPVIVDVLDVVVAIPRRLIDMARSKLKL